MSTQNLPPPLNRLTSNDQVRRSLVTGENLFIQGAQTAGLFYVASGLVVLKRTTSSGHSVTIHRAQSGNTFAEASLFSETYHCTATAACDTSIIECSRAAINDLFETDSGFSRSMASKFAAQIQESRRQVELLSIRSADERVMAAIKDGMLKSDISIFADAIGLAPETVYRSLSKLCQTGDIIKTARGQYDCAHPVSVRN